MRAALWTAMSLLAGCGVRTGLAVDDGGQLDPGTIVQIATGRQTSCALYEGGRVSCWGRRLGLEEEVSDVTPVTLYEIPGAVQIALGSHGCALLADGRVWCWGHNCVGQLGTLEVQRSAEPIEVPGIGDAVQLDVGWAHTCAVRRSGEVWCWGQNELGQLGDGTIATEAVWEACEWAGGLPRVPGRAQPAPVLGLDDAVHVSAGHSHTCAVLRSGEVRCWGSDAAGRLGNGPLGGSANPTVVLGLDDAVEVGAGDAHTCARQRDGRLACWGWNAFSQLGDARQFDSQVPVVAAPAIEDAVQVAAGSQWSCALRADGEVWCWGDNREGATGDAREVGHRWMPGPVAGAGPARQIDCGSFICCLLDVDVACWGRVHHALDRAVSYRAVPIVGLP